MVCSRYKYMANHVPNGLHLCFIEMVLATECQGLRSVTAAEYEAITVDEFETSTPKSTILQKGQTALGIVLPSLSRLIVIEFIPFCHSMVCQIFGGNCRYSPGLVGAGGPHHFGPGPAARDVY